MQENLIFETHFDIIPFNIYVVDVTNYNIIYINRQLKEHLGDYTGSCCYKVFYETDKPCSFCKIKGLINKEGKPNGKTYIFEHFNDADDRWYQLQEKAICWPDGRIAKYSIAVDISELKETQNRLVEAHAELTLKTRELEILSATDRLTRVYNRLKLDEFLKSEYDRYKRHGKQLSLILLDIDLFKTVNDTHGHQVGDEILCEVAGMLQSRVRKTDILGRWGGEEFMIICPETGLEGATLLAEQLRCTLATHDFPIVHSTTASFGVTELGPDDTITTIMSRVDAAMYKAKEGGRNRVEAVPAPKGADAQAP